MQNTESGALKIEIGEVTLSLLVAGNLLNLEPADRRRIYRLVDMFREVRAPKVGRPRKRKEPVIAEVA